MITSALDHYGNLHQSVVSAIIVTYFFRGPTREIATAIANGAEI